MSKPVYGMSLFSLMSHIILINIHITSIKTNIQNSDLDSLKYYSVDYKKFASFDML